MHFTRAIVHKYVTPFYKPTREPTPIWELCENIKQETKIVAEPHPYERIIARECLNWFNNSRMVAFMHKNSIKSEDEFDFNVDLRKSNMYLKTFGTSIFKLALNNTQFEPVLPLLCSSGMLVFSPESNVPALLKSLRKTPQMILIAGILDGVFLNVNDFLKYGKMNIDDTRASLVQTLQLAAGSNLCKQINYHPSTLVSRLESITEQNDK